MRIALNAQLLSRAQSFRSGGISRHIFHLLAELARDSRGHSYEVFTSSTPSSAELPSSPNVRFRASGQLTARPAARIAWEQMLFPLQLRALRPDLLHALAYAAPLAWRGPSVLTIYDLSFLRFPEAFNPSNRRYLTVSTRLSARRARHVITISHHARDEIVRLLGIPPDRVHVTYLAADAAYRVLPAEQVERFRAEKQLPTEYLFTVGTLEPRKNLTGLLDAYARLPRPRAQLYVAGATGWRYTPVFKQVRSLALEEDVHFLGFVPEEELPLWYNGARLFAFPSLYEGFGLPLLEAMACGTPVICSNAASLPEVAGKAGLLVPPSDPTLLAEALQRVLGNPSQHAAMRAAGLIQASRFSWSSMADQTVRVYEMTRTRP